MVKALVIVFALASILVGLSVGKVESLSYEVVATYPHDSQAWTQGLFVHEERLYESTGLRGQSTLREVELKSGQVKRQVHLHSRLFAEGATLFRGKLYQLTWQAGLCLMYEPKTFKQVGSFQYQGEGWGLTHNEHFLIMSDGSAELSFLDAESYQLQRQITVKREGQPVRHLNELEYVDGYIYANIWYRDEVVKIDPESGEIVGSIDFSDLWKGPRRKADWVLNGIAYDSRRGCFLVTGKFWPQLFLIRLKNKS